MRRKRPSPEETWKRYKAMKPPDPDPEREEFLDALLTLWIAARAWLEEHPDDPHADRVRKAVRRFDRPGVQ